MGEKAQAQAARLLIVDDEPVNRDLLTRWLRIHGHETDEAENGQQALDMIETGAFDLVLLDIMMPGLSGIDVLRRVRETHTSVDLPIVMATAKAGSDDIVEALELGANDYVTKPLDLRVVQARIGMHLNLLMANRALAKANHEFASQLQLAKSVQARLLPADLPTDDRATFIAHYAACEAVGGDLYDVRRIDENRIGFHMADVAGHGISAAMLGATLKMAVDALKYVSFVTEPVLDLPRVLLHVTDALRPYLGMSTFITMQVGVIDLETGIVTLCNAGHNLPLRSHATEQRVEMVEVNRALPVPFATEEMLQVESIPLKPGDRLLLYTDGLSETHAGDPDNLYGDDRLCASMTAHLALPLGEMVKGICRDAEQFAQGFPQADDIALFALEWHPKTA